MSALQNASACSLHIHTVNEENAIKQHLAVRAFFLGTCSVVIFESFSVNKTPEVMLLLGRH